VCEKHETLHLGVVQECNERSVAMLRRGWGILVELLSFCRHAAVVLDTSLHTDQLCVIYYAAREVFSEHVCILHWWPLHFAFEPCGFESYTSS
jgi:hypothetical protein